MGEATHPASDKIKALVEAELLTLRKEKLKTETDPEDRLPGFDLPEQRIDESCLLQCRDPVGKRPHPRQHDSCRVPEQVRLPDHAGRDPYLLESLLDAPQICAPALDGGNPVSSWFIV